MRFTPGQSGNPAGNPKSKLFIATLERAIVQDDGKRLRAAAEKLLDLAAAGEPWAIQMLADRLDGKPSQQIDMAVGSRVEELSDGELCRIAASCDAATTH